jgi:tetratricopeptide (TPR) repeat protein
MRCEFALCPRLQQSYHAVVSVLLIGFLGGVLATNAPPAPSNAVPEAAVASIPVIDTNDPVENEYYKVMVDDDAAEKEILGWMENADASAKAGGGASTLTLNLKIQQRLDGIKQEYEDFIERHPRHVNIRLAFGSFLNDNHEDEDAFKQWENARQLAPTNPAAWNNLGKYYLEHNNITNAFTYYGKALELNPSQSVYYHNLAAALYLFRDAAREFYHLDDAQVFDKAQTLYRQAIKLDPDNFVLSTDYAQSFYGINPPLWKEGLAAWEEALKLAHDDVEREGVYLQMAHIHLELGEYDQARSNLAVVTNADYAKLKAPLTRDLNRALSRLQTNAPPAGNPAK